MAELSKVNVNSTDYDLKDQKSRDALVDAVNNGAKNRLGITLTSGSGDGLTWVVNGDGSVTVSGKNTGNSTKQLHLIGSSYKPNEWKGLYLSGVSGGAIGTYNITAFYSNNGSTYATERTVYNGALKIGDYDYIRVSLQVAASYEFAEPYTFIPMICTKAEWDISQAYVPYGKTNAELTAEKTDMIDVYGRGIEIPENADLHTYTTPGVYFSVNSARTATLSNAPNISAGFRLVVTEETSVDGSRIRHDLYPLAVAYSNFYSENLGSTSTTYPDGWRPWATYGPITTNPDSTAVMDYMAPSAKKFYDDQQRQETEIGVVANAGAKNLLKVSVPDAKTNAGNTGFTWSGNTASKNHVSFEIKDDLTVYVKSDTGYTASDVTIFYITDGSCAYPNTILNGCPSGGSATTYELRTATPVKSDYGSGVKITSDSATNVVIIIRSGWSGELTFRPMIRSAVITDTSYQPYARSNPALTAEMDYVVNAGAKNYCPKETETSTGSGFTADVEVNIPAGTYILSFTGTLAYTASFSLYRALPHSGNSLVYKNLLATTGAQSVEFTITEAAKYIAFYHNGNGNSLTNIMIRSAVITDPTFQPYARTNRELTVLTDEDRAALVEIVDGGAKNLLKNTLGSGTKSGLVYTTGTDGSIVITAGTPTANADFVITFTPTKTGQYVLQGCPSGGSGTTYKGQITLYPSMTNVVEIFDNTSVTATLTGGTQYAYRFRVYSGKAIGDVTIYPMVCSEAAWKISTTYQPYRLTIDEKKNNQPTVIVATSSSRADLNTYVYDGTYVSRSSSTSQYIDNCPVSDAGFVLNVYDLSIGTGTTCIQEIIDTSANSNRIYTRRKTTSGWTVWCVITGNPVVSA